MWELRLCTAALTLLWSMRAALGENAPATQPDESSLQICLAAAADWSPVYPTVQIPISNEVDAVFRLAKGEKHKHMAYAWKAVDVKGISSGVVLAHGTIDDYVAGVFKMNALRGLETGKYRLEVTADDQPWKSQEFEIVAAQAAPAVASVQDLLPLRQGTTWTYAFVLEVAEDAGVFLADVAPGADGKFRATLTLSVAGIDDKGAHVETCRNGKLVFEEWWKLDSHGLVSTLRKAGDETLVMDPEQVMWPWPLKGTKHWTYTPKDRSYKLDCRVWGPLAVAGPSGQTGGYVVLMEQEKGHAKLTDEKHFVPGIGLVREIMINANSGQMLNRQEIVLQGVK
ncbi:MAG: hypothetical protein ABR964_04755 [Tepidisphaeraceae bacterium]|jgi:hypothetical protein